MASKPNAGYPGVPSYYEYTAPTYATLAPSGSSQETARLVQPQAQAPAYPPVYSTTTSSYSTMNGQYYTAVPAADKPYGHAAANRNGSGETLKEGTNVGKKACVGLLMCCLTLGPLLMFFLFPRYPLIEFVNSVSPGTVGDFTIQIDYYWNFQNWNYVTAYFDTFEYTVTAPGLVLGYGQNASVVELAGRTITPVMTTTYLGGRDELEELRRRCDAGERVQLETNFVFGFKVLASNLVWNFGPSYSDYQCEP